MRVLIVSATEKEIQPLLNRISIRSDLGDSLKICKYNRLDIDILIAGIGMVSTAYYCAKTITDAYDYSINLGIAGSFNKAIPIGTVVNVLQDRISELGAEAGEELLSLKELNLKAEDIIKDFSSIKNPVITGLRKCKGITVNTVHGNHLSIAKAVKKFAPDVETMEGAAFLFACKKEGIPCVQIRSISNFVEHRNMNDSNNHSGRQNWNIPLAIKNLNEIAIQILDEI